MKDLMHDEVEQTLQRDPLLEFEQLTGKSYKDPSNDPMAMLAHAMRVNDDKRAALAVTNDVHCGTDVASYLRITEDLGFSVILHEDFKAPIYEHGDSYYVLWRPDGVLLEFESYYGGTSINSGKFYYNWLPTPGLGWSDRCGCTSSGKFIEGPDKALVWVGDHDCREAVRHNLARLEANGRFVSPWVERPGVFWLTHYAEMKPYEGDHRGYSDAAKRITAERISRFPRTVQEQIKGKHQAPVDVLPDPAGS